MGSVGGQNWGSQVLRIHEVRYSLFKDTTLSLINVNPMMLGILHLFKSKEVKLSIAYF